MQTIEHLLHSTTKPHTTYNMNKIVPMISSGTAGPIGVLHLPRLWQKASLDTVNKLHPEYPAVGNGYDQMVLDAIGIDRDVFIAYIASDKPSYSQLEEWVLEQSASDFDAKVEELNSAILGYIHTDEVRTEILEASGHPDKGIILDAVNLNNLDDWAIFHAQEIK